MSYVGLAVGWLLSGIQAMLPTGSVVTKLPSFGAAVVLTRNQPSVEPSPSVWTPGRPL